MSWLDAAKSAAQMEKEQGELVAAQQLLKARQAFVVELGTLGIPASLDHVLDGWRRPTFVDGHVYGSSLGDSSVRSDGEHNCLIAVVDDVVFMRGHVMRFDRDRWGGGHTKQVEGPVIGIVYPATVSTYGTTTYPDQWTLRIVRSFADVGRVAAVALPEVKVVEQKVGKSWAEMVAYASKRGY